jgi:hypothetical protein
MEYDGRNYIMSFLNDFNPISTERCNTLNEAVYNMSHDLNRKFKSKDNDALDLMREMKELCVAKKLPIEFIGINLMNSAPTKESIANRFECMVDENLEFVAV